MITRKHVRRPLDDEDAKHLRTLAGVMAQHHVREPWWNLKGKLETYVAMRAYALRSMELGR